MNNLLSSSASSVETCCRSTARTLLCTRPPRQRTRKPLGSLQSILVDLKISYDNSIRSSCNREQQFSIRPQISLGHLKNMADQLATQPPRTSFLQLSYPAPRVVMLTMSREKDLNCTSSSAVLEMTAVFRWFDAEPSLTVAILTGAGKRSFSTGADLKEWNAKVAKAVAEGRDTGGAGPGNVPGAEGLSNRRGKKPFIAAVNGSKFLKCYLLDSGHDPLIRSVAFIISRLYRTLSKSNTSCREVG